MYCSYCSCQYEFQYSICSLISTHISIPSLLQEILLTNSSLRLPTMPVYRLLKCATRLTDVVRRNVSSSLSRIDASLLGVLSSDIVITYFLSVCSQSVLQNCASRSMITGS